MNNNGSIDYTEFLAACLKSKIYLKEDYLRTAFEYFDRVKFKNYLYISFNFIYRTVVVQFQLMN
jgi:Ca2+-binding EF-hand superfamily protein